MEQLPRSDSSLLVRVAEGDDAVWSRLKAVVATENEDGFRAYVEVVDAAAWHGATFDRLRAAVPRHADGASVLFAADRSTLESEEFPVVVIDLMQERPEWRTTRSGRRDATWYVSRRIPIA